MKTERRHELQENALAHELEFWTERIKPYLAPLLLAVGVGVGALAALSWWNASRTAENAAAWEAYQLADLDADPERQEMYRLANSEQFAGTDMQQWAFASWADRQLLRASQLFLIDRKNAQERLSTVLGVYNTLSSSASDPDIRSRAQLGAARVYELQDKLDAAKTAYANVQGTLAGVAKEQLARVEGGGFADVSKWLAEVQLPDFKIADETGASGERGPLSVTPPTPDSKPAGLNTSRSLEEILGSFDEPKSSSDGGGEGAPAGEAAAAPEGPAPSTAAETPAAETPAAETPAAEPATEPAADKSAP